MEVNKFKCEIEKRIKKSEYYTDKRFELKTYKKHKTIRMCKIAVVKIKKLQSGTKLEVGKRFLEFFQLKNEAIFRKSDTNWAKVPFNESTINRILNGAKTVFEECYKEGSVEIFGCCSRFVECSDNKKCVHPDEKVAQGCMYKSNLEQGRIFYGKNCNVGSNKGEQKNGGDQGQQAQIW